MARRRNSTRPWSCPDRRHGPRRRRPGLAAGDIFNLGHGVIPSTDPDQLARLTAFVQGYAETSWVAGGELATLSAVVSVASLHRSLLSRRWSLRLGSRRSGAALAAQPPPQRQADRAQQQGEGKHRAQGRQPHDDGVAQGGPPVPQTGQEPGAAEVRGGCGVRGRHRDVEVDRGHAGSVHQVVALRLERLVLPATPGDGVLEAVQLADDFGGVLLEELRSRR